jgi:hypothetical protein
MPWLSSQGFLLNIYKHVDFNFVARLIPLSMYFTYECSENVCTLVEMAKCTSHKLYTVLI